MNEPQAQKTLGSPGNLLTPGELESLFQQACRSVYRDWRRWRILPPRNIPQWPGSTLLTAWLPASVVSGDYFVCMELDDARLGFGLADVVGKGIPATVLQSSLKESLKAAAYRSLSPGELCTRLNRQLADQRAPGKFITFFYGILDSTSRRLLYTNAGHVPPVVLRRDGSLLRLAAGGPVLGCLPEAGYEQGALSLAPGDCILLFTDGLSEITNRAQEEFGEERLLRLLCSAKGWPATELRRRVLEETAHFCQGDFHDDATLALLSLP